MRRRGTDPLDDVSAFFLTIGSPPLAAYSLQITQINARWLSRAFSDIDNPDPEAMATAVSALQHIPIQLSTNPTLLPSLIVLPQNRAYWRILFKSARKIRRWTIPIVVNFVWVVVSALLTTIDTFSSPVPGEIGYGTITSLTYLLPLMIGWLYVGSEPESNHLRDSLDDANSIALVTRDEGGEPVLAEKLVGQPIEFVKKCDVDLARRDELRTNPIYNYSRVFPWSQNAEKIFVSARNAAVNAEREASVDKPSDPKANVATGDRNWTTNDAIRRCAAEDTAAAGQVLPFHVNRAGIREPSIWATDVWKRVALAAGLGIGLQWGTTGAGLFIYYQTRPVGLGCRTTPLMIYGILGTISFLLHLASSVLAHLSRPSRPRPGLKHGYCRRRSLQETGAIFSRRLGKTLAMMAGVGIMVISLIQPIGVFDNCWCSTKTFDRPQQPVQFMEGNFAAEWGVNRDWIGGLAMACATASIFGLSLYFGTPRRR